MKRRIGILTSGGDCPGLNACIRGVARASYSMFDTEIVGIQDGYAGLIAGVLWAEKSIRKPAKATASLTNACIRRSPMFAKNQEPSKCRVRNLRKMFAIC